MSRNLSIDALAAAGVTEVSAPDLPSPLLQAPTSQRAGAAEPLGLIVGELIALTDEGRTPLVLYPGQPGHAALPARTVIDLHGAHIGRHVALMFEGADPHRPIVIGVLRDVAGWPLPDRPAAVEVDADGERLLVSAQESLVLRCGKASITLTKAGKVLIEGAYILSRSSGVNRIKGGAVQLN